MSAALACVALASTSRASSAQVPADTARADTTVFRMEAIRVRATRPIATTGGANAVLLSLESPRAQPVPILEDVLRQLPFVQVRENSRGEAQLTLRGTESRQVAVLVDGVPLTLGWDARTDLSVIPVAAARQVQLFRGLSSVLHGPNVLGGVVEVDIGSGDPPFDPPRTAIEAGVDETGASVVGGRVGGAWSLGAGHLWIQGGAGHRSRDGVPLPGGVEEPVAADDGLRLNSDLKHVSGFFAARYGSQTDGPWVSLSSFAFRAEKGVPPELHVGDPRLWRIPETARVVTALSAGTGWGRTPLGEGDVEASLGLDFGDTQIDSYDGLDYRTVEESEFSDDRTATLRVVGDHTLSRGILRGAFTLAETRHVERIDLGPASRFEQRLVSFGLEVEQPVGSLESEARIRDLRLTAGVSLDRASTPRSGGLQPRDPITEWGARVGGSLVVGGNSRISLGGSRRVRFPSLRELYSGALGRFVPNPDLQPEVLRTLETGITGSAGPLEGQAVLFHQRFSDAIVRTGLGDGRFTRENRNRITAAGLELLAALRVGAFAVGGDLTWQNVSLRDAAAPAAQLRPEYQPEIFGSLDLTGPLALGITGRASVGLVGRQYCVDPDLGRDVALDRSGRLDLLVSREWRIGGPFERLQTALSLDNVTDAAVFDQCGLPQEGRLFRLQFRLG